MLIYGVCFCWNFENIKSAKTHRPDVPFLSSRVTCLFHLHCLSVFWIDVCVLFSSVSTVNSNSVRGWVNICQPDWLLLSISWIISVVLFGFHFHGRRSTYSKEDAEFKKSDSVWYWGGLVRERLPHIGVQFHLPSNKTLQYAVSVLTD